ncbi:MAG: NB-ARC domain-containing protein [Cyanobacteria bacterium J06635_1]
MSRDALIVGINNYQHLNSLTAPAHDAEAVAQRLSQGENFRIWRLPEKVTDGNQLAMSTTQHVAVEELEDALIRLFKPEGKNYPETALFYFSGHGLRRTKGVPEGFLATSDVNPTTRNQGISLKWLRELLQESPVRHQILWIDCCYGSELFNCHDADPGDSDGKSRCFIAAAREFEPAFEDLENPQRSVMTKALLEGLDCSGPGSSQIYNNLLTEHVTQAMKGTNQVPICRNSGQPILLTYTERPVARPKLDFRNHAIPLQMPPLPDHFVERPEYQQQVKDQLLSDDPKVFGTLVVSAIYGLGGIGKSVLASKLAHEDDVQARFADGILWATLGQNPDVLPLLSGWIQALGDNDYKPTAIESASNHLRTLLYDKHALLVVDDVWNPEHLEPFRVGGDGCCVLVTTREARIPEAHKYNLDVMSPDQSLELMTQKLSEPLSDADRQQALAFADRVGYLPLALELAASQIEEGVTWTELFEDFQDEVVRLESLDLYGREDIPDDAKRRKYSLMACFNLSLKQLSVEQLRQFAWLGIVPEDVSLTQEMAVTLWQVPRRVAGSILRTFRSKALLLQGAKQPGERFTYRMHDLMHDLARRLLISPPQPVEEGDLPGLGMTRAEAHSEFLNRYRAKTQNGQWYTLKDDGYIYAHLTWHMEQARQPQEIHKLLQVSNEQGRNGWYEACDAIGKPAGFVNDVGRAWQLAVENYEQAPGEAMALLFRYALIRTSINSLASNVPAELVGALVEKGVWQPAQGLAYAQQTQNPWHRAECITSLVSYLPKALLPETLKTVAQIRDEPYRAYVLSKLAERFLELWPDVLKTISQIQDRYGHHRTQTKGFSYRALALSKLIKQLPQKHLSEAIEIAYQIKDKSDLAIALNALVKRQPQLLLEALEVNRHIEDESDRAHALCQLTEYLPELMFEVLEITRQIKHEYHRATALSSLAKHLPPKLLTEPLEIISSIKDESDRTHALSKLAEHLSPKLLSEALEITRQIKHEYHRATVLSSLAKHLPRELLTEALEITHQIEDNYDRARVLSALAEHLPALLPEALEITHQIEDESDRARILSKLAKYLPPELLTEALEIARQIEDNYHRASVLSVLTEYLPELVPEALEIIRQIKDASERIRVLSKFAKYLPPELLTEALEITRQIEDESGRILALSALTEHLPELLSEALEITRQIKHESDLAYALSVLTEHLPELLTETLEITRQIKHEYQKISVLRVLSKHLSPKLLPEALEITRQIGDNYYRANALNVLAKFLSPRLLPKALEITRQIKDESDRATALCALAEHLPPKLLTEALKITRKIKHESSRAKTLSTIAKYLPELMPEALEATRRVKDESDKAHSLITLTEHTPKLLPEALEATQKIEDESDKAIALSRLAEHVPKLLPEALELTRQVKDEFFRALIISGLAKHLPLQLLAEAMEATCQIKDGSARAIALRALVKYLSCDSLPKALKIMWFIQDKYYCANALQGLLPRLKELSIPFADWSKILDVLAYQNRSHLLKALPDIRPIIITLGDEQAFLDTLQAMRDVCGQWP